MGQRSASGGNPLKVLLADGKWYDILPGTGGLRSGAREFEFLAHVDGREVLIRGPLHGLMAVMEEPGPEAGVDIPVIHYKPPAIAPVDWDDDEIP